MLGQFHDTAKMKITENPICFKDSQSGKPRKTTSASANEKQSLVQMLESAGDLFVTISVSTGEVLPVLEIISINNKLSLQH